MHATGTSMAGQHFTGQVRIGRIVVYQEHFGHSHVYASVAFGDGANGNVNLKQLPGVACASIQILPPWRSMIFLQIDRPMPLPVYSSRVCRRRKITKMSCQWSAGIPMPLSETANIHSVSFFFAETWTTGWSAPRNLMAFAIKF